MTVKGPRRAVFLDRDGVLSRAVVRDGRPFPPSHVEEVELIPGVAEACDLLRNAGVLLFCVTNQPDVARGVAKREQVEAINERLQGMLALDAIATCFHDDKDDCPCRKPKPGMLFDLAGRFAVDLKQSVMVGDRWRDIEAGARAGCGTVFIDYGYDERRPRAADFVCQSLADALPWLLAFRK